MARFEMALLKQGTENKENDRFNLFYCDTKDSVFLHLFTHIKKNDNNICKLLSCENNDLFLEYFKNGIIELVKKQLDLFKDKKPDKIPQGFWVNHIASVFVENAKSKKFQHQFWEDSVQLLAKHGFTRFLNYEYFVG